MSAPALRPPQTRDLGSRRTSNQIGPSGQPPSTFELLRNSVGLLILWLVPGAIALLEAGYLPRTALEWVTILLVAPIAMLAVEAVGELIVEPLRRVTFLTRAHEAVERRTVQESFSLTRIGFMLFEALVLLGILVPVCFFVTWVFKVL